MDEQDDADDVNWEGGDSDDEEESTEAGEVCGVQAINIAIRVGPENDGGKKAKKATKINPVKKVIFTEDDYDVCFQRCQESMDEILALGLKIAHAASSDLVRASLLDLLPHTLAPLEQYKRRFDQWIALIRWMKEAFRLISTKDMTVEEGRDGSFAADLVQFVLKNRAGSSHQLCQLFAAIMLNLGYKVRLVTTVDLVSCSPQEHPDVYKSRWVAVQGEDCAVTFKDRKYAKPGDKHSWLEVFYEPEGVLRRPTPTKAETVDLEAVVDLTDETDAPNTNTTAACAAAETNNYPNTNNTTKTNTASISEHPHHAPGGRGRWVHVDPAHQRIDLPSFVEDVLRKGKPLQYVIAFEYSQLCARSDHHSNGSCSGSSSSSSSSGSSSSSTSSNHGGGKAPSIKVVDVTGTYKRQHHYTTRRDKEAHALLDTYLATCLQELNSSSVRTDSDTPPGSSAFSTTRTLPQAVKPIATSSACEPVDLCSDSEEEEEDDRVVDLTDDVTMAQPRRMARHNTAVSCTSANSSSSGCKQQHVSDSQSSQHHMDVGDYDLSDYANEVTDVADFAVTNNSSSGSSGSNKRKLDTVYTVDDDTTVHSTTNTNTNTSSAATNTADTDQLLNRHPLPGKFQDFKDHPVYFLERHLLSEQALHPAARVVAVFKGESVYLQAHKENLRTKLQWRRSLRQVRRGEEPIKVVQRSVRAQNDSGVGGDGGSEGNKTIELRLFGSWQTEKIVIPPIVDGIIPINAHGNIEVWEGRQEFVPMGAVYIPQPSAIKAARSLELPCAPAVTGFERRGLHTVPIIGGVVVLQRHAAIVQDASYYVEAVREETAFMKREKELTGRWERLAYGMLSRQKLREKYGH